MAKLTTSNITDGDHATATNTNMTAIETAMENTLSLDGTSPNSMTASLDLNSNTVLNMPAAVGLTEPVQLQQMNAAITAASGLVELVSPSYPISAAETAAAVTPTDLTQIPGDLRRYGAVMDGAADDTTALTQAALVGGNLYIPNGILKFSPDIVFALQTRLYGDGPLSVLLPDDESTTTCLSFTADDSTIEGLYVDCQNVEDNKVVSMSGARARVDLTMSDMGADVGGVGTVAGVQISGVDAWVRIRARNFANTGNTNASMPRVLAISGAADDCYADVTCHTGAAGISVSAAVIRPHIHRLECHDMSDNGMYNLGSVNMIVDNFSYEGDEQGWVEQTGDSTTIKNLVITYQDGSGAGITFNDSTNTRIDNCTIIDTASTAGNQPGFYIGSGTSNTTVNGVHFGNIYIQSRGDGVFGWQNGTVNNITIDHMTVVHEHFEAGQTKTFWNHTTGDRFYIGSMYVYMIDTLSEGSVNMTMTLPAALTAKSAIRNIDVNMDLGTNELRIINALQDNVAIDGATMDSSGRLVPNGNEESGAGGRSNKIVWAKTFPSAGTWQVGDLCYDTVPDTGQPLGWVCTTAGTSGTWTPFGGVNTGTTYTLNATVVEDRTLLQSSAATAENNNNVIAALITDLKLIGLLT